MKRKIPDEKEKKEKKIIPSQMSTFTGKRKLPDRFSSFTSRPRGGVVNIRF